METALQLEFADSLQREIVAASCTGYRRHPEAGGGDRRLARRLLRNGVIGAQKLI
jgi:hypothetical protein